MNQKDLLLKIMVESGHVSKVIADSYRIGNIKGRISELRIEQEWRIDTSWGRDTMGKKYARYLLTDNEEVQRAVEYLRKKGIAVVRICDPASTEQAA